MKYLTHLALIILLSTIQSSVLRCQDTVDPLTSKEEVKTIIDSIASVVQASYISEEIGNDIADSLFFNLKKGDYFNLTLIELCDKIKTDLRKTSGDLHMSAFIKKEGPSSVQEKLSFLSDNVGRPSNYGIVEASIKDDNIGYLRISNFTKWRFFEEAKKSIHHSLGLLRNCDALIIDVRNNPGGFEAIVAFLISFFIENESLILQEYYCRYIDYSSTIETVNVDQYENLLDIPIHILINKRTGSAAESFAYIMKHLKRAEIIGEPSAGAGNGARNFRIYRNLYIQVAVCETFNAITKTSWEKKGVQPTHYSIDSMSLEQALILSKRDAALFNDKKLNHYRLHLDRLDTLIHRFDELGSPCAAVTKATLKCLKDGLYSQSEINDIGYQFLETNPLLSSAIFLANVKMFPHSGNVYDSYGDGLLKLERWYEAMDNYKLAIKFGEENNDENLSIYRSNFQKVRALINTVD